MGILETLFAGETRFNCGKSYLFSCDPEALQDAFDIYPLEIQICMEGDPLPIGVVLIPWSPEFNTLLTLARTEDSDVSPIYIRTSIEFKNPEKTKTTGTIHLITRLSYFGTSIQTSFEVKSERAGKKYLFKNVGGDTKFQMQKIGSGTSAQMIPVAAMFEDQDIRQSVLGSLDPVFIQNSSPPQSYYNVPMSHTKGPMIQVASDILSLIVRPDEKEFFNVFDIGKVRSDQSTSSTDLDISPKDLTVEEIRKQLCNDPDCPGTQKFIELGIHPLAKNKNLGAVMGPTNIPLDYGLSQTYGVMERYGPYGYYTKPKCLEEPFVQKQQQPLCEKCSKNATNAKIKQKRRSSSCCENEPLRLCGGCPLRLRGGGGGEDIDDPLRLRGGNEDDDGEEFPQPMAACKGLMDDFDKLLAEYKKAMGPCGKATCPYAGTIVEEQCKKGCTENEEEEQKPPKQEGSISACGADECPHSRLPYTKVEQQFQAKQLKPACGAATCPYTRQKLEMGRDGDAFSKTCGTPKCPGLPSNSLPPLEPVHWDCPDPLPKGLCKNPDCPHLPLELKVFKPRKGPCGGVSCPYAPPPWCGSPVCPFGPPRPCPFAPPCPPPKPEMKSCPMPDCPFANQWPGQCDNPQCPHKQLTAMMYAGHDVCGSGRPQQQAKPPDENFCGNPDCPHADTTSSVICPFGDNDSVCDNPDCPHKDDGCDNGNGSPKKDDLCDNPQCPFQKKPPEDFCGDPRCPNKPQSGDGGGGGCPFAPKMSDICDNPDCPFSSNRNDAPCFMPGSSGESCTDATCPYATPPPPCPYHPCMYPYPPPPCAFRPPITCGVPDCPYDNLVPCPMPSKSPPPSPSCAAPCKGSTSSSSSSGKQPKVPSGGDGNEEEIPETAVVSCNRCSSDDPCLPTTCTAGGGEFECEECMEGGGSQSAPALGGKAKKGVQRRTQSDRGLKKGGKKKKHKGRYVYSIGDKYPGVHVGHRDCCLPGCRVPPKMGWLWNIPSANMKRRRGWRPGAIGRTIAKRIYEYRKSKGMDVCDALTTHTSKRRRGYESESDITVAPKPTLQIKKKDGAYLITMNPLKDPKTLADNENPYMDCTPLQFKIIKNKDKLGRRPEDGDNEMRSCYCDEYDWPASSESSDSELDIEFTPPAGIIRPERLKKKKNVVHTDTQYNPDDCKPADKLKLGKGKGGDKGKGKKDKKEKKGGKKGKKKK